MDAGWGLRIDGTPKGPGFSSLMLPNGSVMTEYSLGGSNGVHLYPAMYYDITPWDQQTLYNDAVYGYDPLANEVFDRAYQASLIRMMQGKSPFYQSGDGQPGVPYTPIHW